MLNVQRPEIGGDPYFAGGGHRFYVRNGAEQFMLDLAPRALWQVAEQLLGEGTVVWPAGEDDAGITTGPCFMCDDAVGGLATHLGKEIERWPEKGSFTTEEALRLPKTGPVWLNGQGTRGLYCTLPNSPSPGPEYRGAHSDGACYGRWRLQIAAYVDDLPPNSGGFTVWPGSHSRIWRDQWDAFLEGEKHTDKHLAERKSGGYNDPRHPAHQGRYPTLRLPRPCRHGGFVAHQNFAHGWAESIYRRPSAKRPSTVFLKNASIPPRPTRSGQHRR